MIRFFRHYISSSALLQILGDAGFFFCAVYVAPHLVGSHYFHVHDTEGLLARGFIFAAVMVSSMTAGGLYEPWGWEGGLFGLLKRILLAISIGIVVMLFLFYAFPNLFIDHWVLAVSLVLSATIITTQRIVALYWMGLKRMRKNILVLGTSARAAKIEHLYHENDRHLANRINILGYLPYGNIDHHHIIAKRILPLSEDLLTLAERYRAKEIVVAVRDRRGILPMDELFRCRLKGIKVTELSDFFEREVGALQLDSVNTSWLIYSDGFQHGLIVKRIFDILTSSILLILTLPLMLGAVLLVALESRGSVIYTQERVCQFGRPFTIYKFRSMCKDAEKTGQAVWASVNDTRITRFGAIMRKFRIDELPQIFNVLRGDMSFVGPRPERPAFVDEFNTEFPLYQHRHNLKPGITGWAQVCYPYGSSKQDTLEKLQYDLYYVKNHSIFLDIMILMKTVQTVLWGKGAR